ncbi:hypothetical protein M9Y10_002589 [Tritrichomonas musculus]|uniref:RRP12 HEAT domain-containing protein n=1 Tax=Tritrichomonas musculus TaxID=1915356 RepID=A0ABR2LA73_9EUKA
MSNSDHDIFAAYECLRNDKAQKRFIDVLDLIRNMIVQQAQTQSIVISPFPSAKLYLTAICSLLDDRLSKNNLEGLPELLRCLNIALDASTIDSSIASSILRYLLPFFDQKSSYIELQVALCPACSQLMRHITATEEMVNQLIIGLCTNALSDDSRLRKAASQALYDFPQIQEHAFNFVFEISSRNPLRALNIAKNLAPFVSGTVLSNHFQDVVQFSDNPNRNVRVKAMQIIAIAFHYMPDDGVLNAIKLFTNKIPEGPGEIVQATTELIQSAMTKLAHSNISLLKANITSILHSLILFLTIGDNDNNELIDQTFLYGLHASIQELKIPPDTDPLTAVPDEDKNVIQSIVNELTNSLSVQFINIWSHIYKYLDILPNLLKAATFVFLQAPIISSLEKMTNQDTKNIELITNFVVSCANEIGLLNFFRSANISPNDIDHYTTIILPILSGYSSKKNLDDLAFTIDYLMPAEEIILDNSQTSDDCKRIWHQLWNAIPNCVTTNKTYIENDDGNFFNFVNRLCNLMESNREFIRPICRIFQSIGPFCGDCDNVLPTLLNMAVDQSTSSSVIPAVTAVIRNRPPEFINNFFVKLMSEKILPLASDPNSINIACALIDVAMALAPFISEENRNNFYQVLITFIQQKSHLQKKALRTLRNLLEKYRTDMMKGASAQLVEILNNTKDSISSSTVRYRLLLMSTLLQLPDDLHGEMLLNFLPEFVAALKDSGAKTREAATECIYAVADELVKLNSPLGPVLSALSIGLAANVSTIVSASIDALNLIIRKYYDHVTPDELSQISNLVWKSTITEAGAEILRSAIKFASGLIKKLPKFVKECQQLRNLLQLGVNCIKEKNWEIKGKGRKLIEKCIDEFGIDSVSECFPEGEEKLLRGARKEYNRDTRKKEEKEKEKGNKNAANRIELDRRFDLEARDLNDPRETINRENPEDSNPKSLEEEGLEFDKRGRLVLKEAGSDQPNKKRKGPNRDGKGVSLDDDDDDDEDAGNEVALHIRQKRMIQKQQEMKKQREQFVTETGDKFKASKGKGDKQKDGQVPYSFAPLTSKSVNKRYRGQMKAAYKKLFKNNQ